MTASASTELAPLFRAVGQALRQSQAALNQADALNGNHGDHMVEIFRIAAMAAQEKQSAGLAEAMSYAASLLEGLSDNGSAVVYARGLRQLAEQLQRHGVSLEDLVGYVRKVLREGKSPAAEPARAGEVLKALVAGLANWSRVEEGKTPEENPVDMGVLFEFGMAYLEAKLRGGKRAEVLAEAAASVSPLSKTPQRYRSGRLAIRTLLEAMQSGT